jgi:TetR/AcrR family transcriptional regulator
MIATDSTDNRARIRAAATRLFATRGYEAVGIQEIVEAVGITKPTLYHYFGSKRGLLDAILADHFADLFAAIEPVARYSGHLPNDLTALAAAYFRFAERHRAGYRLQLALWFAPPQSEAFAAIAPHNERQGALLEKLFLDSTRDNGNGRGRQRAYALTFLGTVNTYIGLLLNDYLDLDDATTRRAVHQFMHGIFS